VRPADPTPAPPRPPRGYAVVAGSGLGALGEAFAAREVVPFAAIAGVGETAVAGHRGEVRFCDTGRARCAIVLGRRHHYEAGAEGMRALLAWLAARGTTDLVAASAAGALDTRLHPGDLVLVHDLIDLQNRERGGRAAATLRSRVDRALTAELAGAARRARVPLHPGTLACGAGPAYETPAEVRFLQAAGADVVTMSAAPEVTFARQAGLRAAVIAVVTNPGTGIGGAVPGHEEVLRSAAGAAGALTRLIGELIDMQ